jgi:NAD(P)-dependent dehydrogenase (short-subunit alcohol dehydrogenase family)
VTVRADRREPNEQSAVSPPQIQSVWKRPRPLDRRSASWIENSRHGPADTLAKQCGGGAIETIVGDMNDARFVDGLANRARDVDILVNNAGYPEIRSAHGHDRHGLRGHVPHQCARLLSGHAGGGRSMMERRRGHIIIMTSIAAREVYPLGVIYRDQARSVGIRPRSATRVAGSRHQGHRNRSRDGRYRHPCQQRSPPRAGGPEG